MARDDIPVLAAISVGGALGALARFGTGRWFPTAPHHIPWSTFAVNVSGCFLIGVLMVLITEVWTVHRLVRPFFGVGVLGGYTTFSTYAVDIRNLTTGGEPIGAAVYLIATLFAALVAVVLGMALARFAARTGPAR